MTGGDGRELDELKAYVVGYGAQLDVDVESFSSNHQDDILEFIHESVERVDGYIINPAGAARGLGGGSIQSSFTHTAAGMCMGMRHYSYVAALTAMVFGLDDEGFLGRNQDR